MLPRLALLSVLLGLTVAQMPTYMSTKYAFPSSSGVSSATLQSLLARQLYSSSSSPKKSYSAPSAPTPRYGLPSASNPSIVAIPLYVRNQQAAAKTRALYEILANSEKKSASNKYLSYLPKKSIESSIPYRSESLLSKYERPTYSSYPKYDQPKAASSQYEPVRSYELKQSEPGYGDASSVSLLSGNYGSGSGSISVAYPPSSYKQSSGSSNQPRLKAVEYDDSQKSALADFASALENFELKQITNQDIYDLPAINPPLSRIPAKQESRGEDSYGSSSGGYAKSQSYEAPAKQSYAAPAAASDDSQSSYGSSSGSSYGSSGQSYSAPEYAASSDSYRPASESYRPAAEQYRPAADSYRVSESYRPKDSYSRQPERVVASYSERSPSSSDSYRASGTDSFGSSALYVPAPSSYDSSSYSSSSSSPETTYSVRPSSAPSSYSSSSSDYYGQSVSPNPDDPNCPYKVRDTGSVEASSSDYAEAPASVVPAPTTSSYQSSNKLNAYKQALAAQAGYGANGDELDPSKLELKIVHLPVSVLKRLVGSGELALPSFNKKK